MKISLPLTSVCLSVGEERANTRSLGQTLSMRSCSTYGRHAYYKPLGQSELSQYHSLLPVRDSPNLFGPPNSSGTLSLKLSMATSSTFGWHHCGN